MSATSHRPIRRSKVNALYYWREFECFVWLVANKCVDWLSLLNPNYGRGQSCPYEKGCHPGTSIYVSGSHRLVVGNLSRQLLAFSVRLKDAQTGKNEAEKLLVESYQGAIEFLFELGTWLTYIDEDAQSTRNIIESVVKEAILQNYDRSKAITCLTDEASADTMEWLSQMVESPTWRQTIYNLAQHPRNEDCPFLSLSMPCIAVKESLIGELISVPLAWNTLGIFLKCVIYVLQPLLAAGDTVKDQTFMYSVAFLQPKRNHPSFTNYANVPHSEMGTTNSELLPAIDEIKGFVSVADVQRPPSDSEMLPHFLEMGCHSEHGYLLLQSILQCLAQRMKGHCAYHLIWLLEAEASRRGRDVSRYTTYLCGARDYPESMDAMRTILKEQDLVPDAVLQLEETYKRTAPPPVALLHQPIFIGEFALI
ncbi:unnamed protein product [Heterobilharzia americana]|nr:unnamed protein product [Heterobilharzia americana]